MKASGKSPTRKTAEKTSSTSKAAQSRTPKKPRKSPAKKPARQREVVVILGMHRSGTSALTRVLNMLGAQVPHTLMGGNESNKSGHWESTVIRALNDEVLESAGSKWHDWHAFSTSWYQTGEVDTFHARALQILKEEYDDTLLLTFKDPRVCRIFPFWKDVFKAAKWQPKVILALRHPIEVAASLTKRNGSSQIEGLLLWLRHMLQAEYDTRGMTRTTVSYDTFLADPNGVTNDLQKQLGIIWPRMSELVAREIEDYITPSERNQTASTQDHVEEAPIIQNWLDTAYRIFMKWSDSGEKKADYADLDRLRMALDDPANPLRGVVSEVTRLTDKLKAQQDALEDSKTKLTATQTKCEKAEQDKAALQQNLDKTDASYRSSESQCSKLVQDRITLQRMIDQLDANHQAAEDARVKLSEDKATLHSQLEQAKAEVEAAKAVRSQLEQAKTALETTLGKRDEDLVRAKSEAAAERKRLTDEADGLKGKLEHIERDHTHTKTQMQAVQQKSEEQSRLLADLTLSAHTKDTELVALTNELLNAQETLETAKKIGTDLQERLKSNQEEVMTSASNVLDLEEQVKGLQAQLNETKRHADTREQQLAAQIAEKQAQIETQQAALQTGQNMLTQTKALLETRTEENSAATAQLRAQLVQNETEIESQQAALKAVENTLSQTESALRQRTHETEQTAAELRLLKAAREKDVDTLQTQVEQLEQQVAQSRAEMMDLRRQNSDNTDHRFKEVAALTKQLMEREGTLINERAQLVAEVGALKKDLNARATELQGEKVAAQALATENTVLLQHSEKGHGLAGRVSETLQAVIEGDVLGRNILKPLADRRKARLLQAMGLFDAKWYNTFYADVREQGVDPALHFIRCGYAEGRAATPEMAGLQTSKTPSNV